VIGFPVRYVGNSGCDGRSVSYLPFVSPLHVKVANDAYIHYAYQMPFRQVATGCQSGLREGAPEVVPERTQPQSLARLPGMLERRPSDHWSIITPNDDA
jgi:hypothetical protein